MNIKKFVLIGGLIGFLVIFYDYDFLLNIGGPSTSISDTIVKFLFPGQFICCWETFRIASLVMIVIGIVVGFLFILFFHFLNRIKNK